MTGKQLKNSILQWAIQGKLVPQDPNDEPASVLLEQIRAEKARLTKEGKIKKDKKESIIFRGEDNSYYEKFADGKVVCIDDEIPFEVSNGWELARFGSVMYNRDSERIPLSVSERSKLSKTYDYYGASGVIDKVDKYLFDKDLLLIGEDGANLINRSTPIAYIATGKYWVNNHAHVLDCIDSVFMQYVCLYINSISLVDYVTGTAQPKMNQEKMNSILLFVPPHNEQKRILEKVDEIQPLFARYEKNQLRLETLTKMLYTNMRKSILQDAIQGKLVPQDSGDEPASSLLQRIKEEKQRLVKEGKLKKKDAIDSVIFKGDDNKYYEQIGGEIVDITDDITFDVPKGWSWCRLKSICAIFTGATFKKEDARTDRKGIRILRGGNILPFDITFKADDIFLPCNFVKENILLQKNDIVTPAVTSLENIGKMARIKGDLPDVTVGGFVFVLRLYYSNDWLSKYLLTLMGSPTIIEYMKSISNKSGQAFYNIGKERLATTLLPIPPHCEQQRIVNQIAKIFSEIKGTVHYFV